MTVLTLWSVQTDAAWNTLADRGSLHGDGRRIADRSYRPAYAWMMGQMRRRIAGYGGAYPIWAWHRPKPDLRRSGLLASGSEGVLLELSVDARRVLLSDFDTWHFVLNRSYIALNEDEDDAFEKAKMKHGVVIGPMIEASWERIFDLSRRPNDWLGAVTHVQAVIEEVRREDVTSVTRFTAR